MKSMGPLAAGLCLGIAVTVLAAAPSSAGVIISSNNVASIAYDAVFVNVGNSFIGTTIPTSHTLIATDGTASSTTQIEYSVAAPSTILSYTLTHQRPGTFSASAASSQNSMNFTVDVASTYSLSGYYDVTDVAGAAGSKSPGDVYFGSRLYDVTDAVFLLDSFSESQSTIDEGFVLGDAGGDHSNIQSGALTGDLVVGHTYEWYFHVYTQAFPDDDFGADAVGNVTLVVREKTSLPEPSTLAIFGIGLAGLGFMGRRRRAV